MLIIRNEQQQALKIAAMSSFIVNCKQFIEQNAPEWCIDKSDDDKHQFVEEMIEFSHDCHIYNEDSIQRLIYYKIEYDFSIPLSPYRKSLLEREKFDEDYRIEQFHDSLASGEDELTLVTLENNEDTY